MKPIQVFFANADRPTDGRAAKGGRRTTQDEDELRRGARRADQQQGEHLGSGAGGGFEIAPEETRGGEQMDLGGHGEENQRNSRSSASSASRRGHPGRISSPLND